MGKDEINAFLGAGTTYQGKLNFQGSVRIDGIFTGEITSEGTLIVGKDAKVNGEVFVNQLVLSGQIEGEIVAKKKVVLHKTANLVGSLNTPVLVIEEGAKVEGQVTMGKSLTKAKGTAPESAPAQNDGGSAPRRTGLLGGFSGGASADSEKSNNP